MVISFQMDASVDKEEGQEILVRAPEFLSLFFGFVRRYVYLAFGLGQREAQNISGFFYVAIDRIQLLDLCRWDDDERQGILCPEYLIFDRMKRPDFHRGIRFVYESEIRAHLDGRLRIIFVRRVPALWALCPVL